MKKIVKRLLTGFLAIATMLTAIPMQSVFAAGTATVKFVVSDSTGANTQEFSGTTSAQVINLTNAWTDATQWAYNSVDLYLDSECTSKIEMGTDVSEFEYDESTSTYTVYAKEDLVPLERLGVSVRIRTEDDTENISTLGAMNLDTPVGDLLEAVTDGYYYDLSKFYITKGGEKHYVRTDVQQTLREMLIEVNPNANFAFEIAKSDITPTGFMYAVTEAGTIIKELPVTDWENQTVGALLREASAELAEYDIEVVDSTIILPTWDKNTGKSPAEWWDAYSSNQIVLKRLGSGSGVGADTVSHIKFIDRSVNNTPDIVYTAIPSINKEDVNLKHAFLAAVDWKNQVPKFYADTVSMDDITDLSTVTVENNTATVYYVGPPQNLTVVPVTFEINKGASTQNVFTTTLSVTENLANYAATNAGIFIFNKEDIKVKDFLTGEETPIDVTATVGDVYKTANGIEKFTITIDDNLINDGRKFTFKTADGTTIYEHSVVNPKTDTIQSIIEANFQKLDGYDFSMLFTNNEFSATGNKELTVDEWFRTYRMPYAVLAEEAAEPQQVTVTFIGGTAESPEQYTWTYMREHDDVTVETERAWKVSTGWKKVQPEFYVNSGKTIKLTNLTLPTAETEPNHYTFYFKNASEDLATLNVNVYMVKPDSSLELIGTVTEDPKTMSRGDIEDLIEKDYFLTEGALWIEGRYNTDNNYKHYGINNGYYTSDVVDDLTSACAVDANIYMVSSHLHSNKFITIYDPLTSTTLATIDKSSSNDTVSSLLGKAGSQVTRYDLSTVYADYNMTATADTSKTFREWFDAYGHTTVYVKAIPRVYEIKAYDLVDGSPILAGSKAGLNGSETIGQVIQTIEQDITSDYEYSSVTAYSDLRCSSIINKDMTVAEYCGEADLNNIYFERTSTEVKDNYTLNIYSIGSTSRDIVATNDTLSGTTTLRDAIELTLTGGYGYTLDDIKMNIGLTESPDFNKTLAEVSVGSTCSVYIAKEDIEVSFTGRIINVDYANGEIKQAYIPSVDDITMEGNVVAGITVPDAINVQAIYLPKTIEGLDVSENDLSYNKAVFIGLYGYGIILEENVKLVADMSGLGITHFIAEGPIRLGLKGMDSFFKNCKQLRWVEGFEYVVGDATSFNETFSTCTELRHVELNGANADLTQVFEFTNTFKNDLKLEEVLFNGIKVGNTYAMFTTEGKSRATSTEKSPLKKIAFTNCDFGDFDSTFAFQDAYCEYDLTGSTNLMRANMSALFKNSYSKANSAEILNETTLKFTGWNGTLADIKDWFYGSIIANADFSGLTGLANTNNISGVFATATITSDVAKSFNAVVSSDTAVNMDRLYYMTKVILKSGETKDDAAKAIETTIATPVTSANLAFDSQPSRELGQVDYSHIDMTGVTEVTLTDGTPYMVILPKGKLPGKILSKIAYYAKPEDSYVLTTIGLTGGALDLKSKCPNAELMVNEGYKINVINSDTEVKKTISVLPGCKFSDIFDTPVYKDAKLTEAWDMDFVTALGSSSTVYTASSLIPEVDELATSTNTSFKFLSFRDVNATFEDGSKAKLMPEDGTVKVKLEMSDLMQDPNAKAEASTYLKYKDVAIFDISLSAMLEGTTEYKKISQTNTEVYITTNLPADYVKGQGFAVYNYHYGMDEDPIKLVHTINNDGTVTFKTSLFSPFLIAYNDIVEDGTEEFYVKWDDDSNSENHRPATMRFTLYINGTEYDTVNVNVDKRNDIQKVSIPVPTKVGGTTPNIHWTYTIPTGYTGSGDATHEGLPLITYTYEVTGTKQITYKVVFDDEENVSGKRPENLGVNLKSTTGVTNALTLNLKTPANAKEYSAKVNVAKNSGDWVIDSVGTIEGYTVTIDGLTATLKYTPEMMEKNIIIKWEGDGDNTDKTRPSKITVTIQGGSKKFTVDVDEAGNWTNKVSVYKYINGADASYTISAPDQSKYSKVVNGDIITYTFTGTLSTEAKDKEESKEVGVTNKGKEDKGPDYSMDSFDWIDYANKYDDLFKAFGYDKELLYHHYIYNGIREGRVATFTGKYKAVDMDVLEKYTPTSASGAKPDTTIDPNGNTMKEEIEQMGTISKVETDKEGNSTVVTTNPDGSKTETIFDKEGNVVSTQTYKTGDDRISTAIMWFGCGTAIMIILGFVVFGVNSTSIEKALGSKKTNKSKK